MKKRLSLLMIFLMVLVLTGCGNSTEVALCKSLDSKLAQTDENLIGTVELGGNIVKPDVIQKETDNAKKYLQENYNKYCKDNDSEICKELKNVINDFDMFPATSKYGSALFSNNIDMLIHDCDKILNKKN